MMEWQPIETAPKDGTLIDVGWLTDDGLEHGPVRTYWVSGEWVGHYTPTHWMPLLEPPKAEE